MGPPVDAVATQAQFSPTADIVIIGGGIIGVSAALFLARQGLSVTLCEKGRVAGEQSSRNWGWVRRMGRDPRELPLIVEAMNLWDGMQQLVGEDVGFRRTGILYLCEREADIPHHEEWLKSAGDYALDSRIVSGPELAALQPGAARTYRAALYTKSDGRAEPQKAAPAIARAAARAGARILEQCAVRGIDVTAGRISGVVTELGTIRAGTVIVAGGAWSSALCRDLDLRLPQLTVRSSVLRTAPVEGGPEGAAWAEGFAYRKRLDGGYTIAEGTTSRHEIVPDSFRYLLDFLPMIRREWRDLSLRVSPDFVRQMSRDWEGGAFYEQTRVLDPAPVEGLLANARKAMEAVFPMLKGVPTVQQWAGYIDATPDAVPVISPVRSLPGLIIATGFSGHGFGIGPGAGHLAADLAMGRKPIAEPSPFRYERFIDGTKHRPSTGV
jgi:glycine/D-amino acid oxidase-like deaminating enzyme